MRNGFSDRGSIPLRSIISGHDFSGKEKNHVLFLTIYQKRIPIFLVLYIVKKTQNRYTVKVPDSG